MAPPAMLGSPLLEPPTPVPPAEPALESAAAGGALRRGAAAARCQQAPARGRTDGGRPRRHEGRGRRRRRHRHRSVGVHQAAARDVGVAVRPAHVACTPQHRAAGSGPTGRSAGCLAPPRPARAEAHTSWSSPHGVGSTTQGAPHEQGPQVAVGLLSQVATGHAGHAGQRAGRALLVVGRVPGAVDDAVLAVVRWGALLRPRGGVGAHLQMQVRAHMSMQPGPHIGRLQADHSHRRCPTRLSPALLLVWYRGRRERTAQTASKEPSVLHLHAHLAGHDRTQAQACGGPAGPGRTCGTGRRLTGRSC